VIRRGTVRRILLYRQYIMFCSTRRITMHGNRTISSWKYIVYTQLLNVTQKQWTTVERSYLRARPWLHHYYFRSRIKRSRGREKKPCGHYCRCGLRFVWPRFFSLRWTIIIYTITVRCKCCSVCHSWYLQ